MGNSPAKELKDNSTLLSLKELKELQQQILFEYPFLRDVYESMLVSDNTREDCPIVYANDQFETMTLYSKEEVLGRNCRFLQGKHTDRNVIRKVRYAVDNNLPIDVEILNYRKDGVAFWNAFLMLPVHPKGTKAGKATHFIAIQKDTTVLKEVGEDPTRWAPPEVAMWLEQNGMGEFGKAIVNNAISGDAFLNLERTDLQVLGIALSADQRRMMALIENLRGKVQSSQKKEISSASIQSRGSPRRSTVSSSGSSSSISGSSADYVPNQRVLNDMTDADVFDSRKSFWSAEPSGKLAVRCHLSGETAPQLILTDYHVTWDDFQLQIQRTFGPHKIVYIEDGCRFELKEADDFKAVMTLSQGKTLALHLEKLNSVAPLRAQLQILDNLPLPVLVVDAHTQIHYANSEALQLLGLRKDKKIKGESLTAVIPDFDVADLRKYTSFGAAKRDPMRIKSFQSEERSSETSGSSALCDVKVRDTGLGFYTVSFFPDSK